MMRRFAAGFVVIAMLVAGAAPCAGWQASAEARHDCCATGACPDSLGETAGQTNISQEAADQCCASAEEKDQRDGPQSAAAFFAVPPPGALGDVAHTASVYLRRSLPRNLPLTHPAAPLYVLYSVFLV